MRTVPTTTAGARAGRACGRAFAVVALLAAVAGAGCSASAGPRSGPARPGPRLHIVAAENFWGSIAAQLAGSIGEVTSLVNDPNADPHSYESSADAARAMADADYVILNGAGYDSWANRLLDANPRSSRKVLTVATLVGRRDGDNPHLWYDPDYVTAAAGQIEADLEALDPGDTPAFDAQRAALDRAFGPVRDLLARIRAASAGTPVASTESIFVYLAGYLGLDVISPPDFMNAVADGNDPPAPAVAQMETDIAQRRCRVLVYNRQTVTDVTTNLERQAASRDIAVVGVTETIQPPTATFEQWFGTELQQLQAALATGAR